MVDVCVAGHVPPIVAAADGVRLLGAAGLPIGMFCSEQFTVEQLRLAPGDTLMIVTDGVSEAEDTAGVEYGIDRLAAFVHQRRALSTRKLVDACVRELDTHGSSRRRTDDATVLALQREM
jgi:sigma-B regulation protein RsbU (phosphoserine phosphatase)